MPAPVPGHAAPGGRPSGIPGPTGWERLQGFRWPNDERAPRTLTLSTDPPGTWMIEGSSVRRVWGRTAKGWLGNKHIWAGSDYQPLPTWIFDLRSARTVQGKAPGVADRYYQQLE